MRHVPTLLALAAALTCSSALPADEFVTIAGAACTRPPWLHCPAADCPTDRIINPGPIVEMKTRRTFFLDYPCDLKPGDDITLVLSLHGGGSYGNWQRHYFPLVDFVDTHRLVVATPNSPIRVWTEVDDGYLRNIVDHVVVEIGAENVRAFWLAGHSQGGMTSNRILRDRYFAERVDGWISLSGGRLGGNPGRAESFGPPRSSSSQTSISTGNLQSMRERFARSAALLTELPAHDISFIYTTGEREVDASGVPAESSLADSYACDARVHQRRVEDQTAGYVYDGSRQNPPNPAWGLLPAPGTADVYTFPGCRDGRLVADVVRRGKGHTEGLEPEVTRALLDLIVAAPGGRLQTQAKREMSATP